MSNISIKGTNRRTWKQINESNSKQKTFWKTTITESNHFIDGYVQIGSDVWTLSTFKGKPMSSVEVVHDIARSYLDWDHGSNCGGISSDGTGWSQFYGL